MKINESHGRLIPEGRSDRFDRGGGETGVSGTVGRVQVCHGIDRAMIKTQHSPYKYAQTAAERRNAKRVGWQSWHVSAPR